jgi:O-antigen ligase
MAASNRWESNNSPIQLWVGIGGIAVGSAAGFLAGFQPLLLGAALGAVIVITAFFFDFKRVLLTLLVVRSALDVFASLQLPTVVAIAIDFLTILYVVVQLLQRRRVNTDAFWWLFAGWILVQGAWPLLCFVGGLGFERWALSINMREWVRLFSWLMIYLLVMQLKDQMKPEAIINTLFLSLILPLTAAAMQIFLPSSLVPSVLHHDGNLQESRIFGTLGHANTFSCFLLLFIGLTWWKLIHSKKRWPWLLLFVPILGAFVSTHSLISLVMLAIFVVIIASTRLNLASFIGGIVIISLVFTLFASSQFGRSRLETIIDTPLFNPKIDVSRAILLQKTDNNSFNWRLYHWTSLLEQWKKSQLLGYGLSTAIYLAPPDSQFIPHNDYIRALVEGGILGLMTFIAFLLAQVIHLTRLIYKAPLGSPQRDLCKILLAVLIATFVAMATDNVWICTAFYFYWWTLIPVVGWNWQKLETTPSPSSLS